MSGAPVDLRVVHTINGLRADHGGPSRSVGALASSTAARGASVEIVAGHAPSDEVIGPGAVPVHLAERPGGTDLLRPHASSFGRALADRVGPESIVHDHGLWLPSNRIASAVASRSSVPRVVSARGMVSAWALAQGAAKKRLAWGLYQKRDLSRAALLHATSSGEAEALRALGLRVAIATIANGVDLPPDDAPPSAASEVRTALFLGRLHPVKGLLDLVEAWARIRPAGWQLVLAGPDEDGHRSDVERALGEAGLTDTVSFTGPVDNDAKWPMYRRADLFVLPSHSENFGIVVAEALAARVPVLTTTGTPWASLATHRCGWWTPTGPDGITAALVEATTLSRDALRDMGERGYALVADQYSWRRAAQQMVEAYTWILNRGPRPDFVTDGLG